MSVADRIKEVMAQRGMTVEAFATAIGDKPQRVKDVLRGKQRVPEDMLVALAGMKVDVAYLLTGMPAAVHSKLGAISQASELMQRIGVPQEIGRELMPAIIEALEAAPSLPADEGDLLNDYRRCEPEDKKQISILAKRLAPASDKK